MGVGVALVPSTCSGMLLVSQLRLKVCPPTIRGANSQQLSLFWPHRSVNPLQLAVYATRIATGRKIMPRLMLDPKRPAFESMNFHGDHVQVIQNAMSEVVNGRGTAGRARLPIDGVLMAGKTGTAQVVSLNVGGGKGGSWKYRDHGLFIGFAPVDKPRYACAVVLEHGGVNAHPNVQLARDALLLAQKRDILGRRPAYPVNAADARL